MTERPTTVSEAWAINKRNVRATLDYGCPWCEVEPRKRHKEWCPCSAESRRQIRAAYDISDLAGSAVADQIRKAAVEASKETAATREP